MPKPLRDFALEVYFSRWEFNAKYHLTASDAESLSLDALLALASPEDRERFNALWLGYTETGACSEDRGVLLGHLLSGDVAFECDGRGITVADLTGIAAEDLAIAELFAHRLRGADVRRPFAADSAS